MIFVMKKDIKWGAGVLGMALLIGLGSCSDDIDPIVEDLGFSRTFSPLDFEVRVLNQTTSRFNWKSKDEATSFVLELSEDSLLFSNIINTYQVDADDLPYELVLDGETRYSARVKAVGGTGLPESNWSAVTFQTGTEQILLPMEDGDVTHNSVVVRWPAGFAATHILATSGTQVVRYDLSESEIADGFAMVEGLSSETAYLVRLMNDTKTRGSFSVTTFVDLGGAIAVYPEDDLQSVFDNAADGDVLALFPGEYLVGTGSINIDKNISIVAVYPTNKPVLHSRFMLVGSGGLEFSLSDVILSGFVVVDGEVTSDRDTY